MKKDNNVKVSACIITYNHENFIEECLEGALAQELDYEYEIVIGDDCSTDGTSMICRKYAELYPDKIRYLYRKKNLGVNKNWSETIKDCKGDYIAMCEGDDYWTNPFKLQQQVNFLENNNDFVLCCHNSTVIDSYGKQIKEKKLPNLLNDRSYTRQELKQGAFLLTLSLVFRNIVKEFPKEFFEVLNADRFLISLLGNYGKGKYLENLNSSCYRVHDGGIWSKLEEKKRFRSKILFNKKIIQYYKRRKDFETVRYYGTNQINISRFLFRKIENKYIPWKDFSYYNILYLKYNNIFFSRYRLKEYTKYNFIFFNNKISAFSKPS